MLIQSQIDFIGAAQGFFLCLGHLAAKWLKVPRDGLIYQYIYICKGNEGLYTSRTYDIKVDNKVVGYIEIGQCSPILLYKEDVNFKIAVNKSIVVSVLITILITVLVSLSLSKQFSTPVVEVSKTSVKLSEGDYDARSYGKGNISEIKNLKGSINILGDKLKKQDEIRKRLVSDISHEIRPPLNVLQNNLEAMADGIFPVTAERLSELNSEVIRFGKLLDNLNVLKKFESEEVDLNIETIHVDRLAQMVAADFASELKEKEIRVELNLTGDKG